MLLNHILANLQRVLNPVYRNSLFLKNIDGIIFVNILAVIFVSAFAHTDCIGFLAMSAILLTVVKLTVKPMQRIRISRGELFLLIYLMIVIISVAGSTLFLYSLKGFVKTITYIGFYFSVVEYLKYNRGKLKYILMALGLTVFAETFIAIKQNFLSVSEISGWQDMSRLNPEDVMTRVYGSLKPYNPNLFGGYMLAGLPAVLIFVYLPLINKSYKTAACGFIMFILSACAVIMTGCRGAYMGLLAEAILLIILTYRFLKPYYKKLFLLFSSVLAALAVTVFISVSSLRARVLSMFAMRGDSSNSFRFNVYNSCIDMFKDNWLLGIGVGNQNFREIYGLYMKTGFDALSAYNIYLETAVESGIFALLAFLAFLISNLAAAVRYIFRRRNQNAIYLVISVISILGLLVHGLVDTVFFRPQLQIIFWLMMGIIRVITVPERVYNVRRRN